MTLANEQIFKIHFPPFVVKNDKFCSDCAQGFTPFHLDHTVGDLNLPYRLTNPLSLPLVSRKKTPLGTGFFKEVNCHRSCALGSYSTVDNTACVGCLDTNCLRCGYPYTTELYHWLNNPSLGTGTCAVCDEHSVKYGPNVELDNRFIVLTPFGIKVEIVAYFCNNGLMNEKAKKFFQTPDIEEGEQLENKSKSIFGLNIIDIFRIPKT